MNPMIAFVVLIGSIAAGAIIGMLVALLANAIYPPRP